MLLFVNEIVGKWFANCTFPFHYPDVWNHVLHETKGQRAKLEHAFFIWILRSEGVNRENPNVWVYLSLSTLLWRNSALWSEISQGHAMISCRVVKSIIPKQSLKSQLLKLLINKSLTSFDLRGFRQILEFANHRNLPEKSCESCFRNVASFCRWFVSVTSTESKAISKPDFCGSHFISVLAIHAM